MKCIPIIPCCLSSIFSPAPTPELKEVKIVLILVVIIICKIMITHFFTVTINSPILSVDIKKTFFTFTDIQVHTSPFCRILHKVIPKERTCIDTRIIIISRCSKYYSLKFIPVSKWNYIIPDSVVNSTLIPSNIIDTSLVMYPGILAMLIKLAITKGCALTIFIKIFKGTKWSERLTSI